MDNKADFTVDPVHFSDLPAFVDEQRAMGLRYVPIVDPAIPDKANYPTFERGLQADAYIRWDAEEGGEVMMGNVRNKTMNS
jgi:alpha-glucosidase